MGEVGRVCQLELEELGQAEGDAEDDDGDDVAEDPDPLPPVVDGVVVLDRLGDGQVALHGQHDRHVDGAAEDKVVDQVEAVAESVLVNLVEDGRVEVGPPDSLGDAAKDVEVVRDGQEDEEATPQSP